MEEARRVSSGEDEAGLVGRGTRGADVTRSAIHASHNRAAYMHVMHILDSGIHCNYAYIGRASIAFVFKAII